MQYIQNIVHFSFPIDDHLVYAKGGPAVYRSRAEHARTVAVVHRRRQFQRPGRPGKDNFAGKNWYSCYAVTVAGVEQLLLLLLLELFVYILY